jgi:hypothetical protein
MPNSCQEKMAKSIFKTYFVWLLSILRLNIISTKLQKYYFVKKTYMVGLLREKNWFAGVFFCVGQECWFWFFDKKSCQ